MRTTLFKDSAIMLALLGLLAGCGGEEGKQAAGPGAGKGGPPPAEVTVVTISRGTVELTDDLPGRLEAYRVAQVRARVEGIVEKRLFQEGAHVKAGATLFQIDPRNYRAAYAAARAEAQNALKTRDRYRELLELRAVSQQEYEQAVARLQQAEAVLSRAQIDLENTRVPAPISGYIGRELVTVGALVGHNEATNLAVIEQVDPIYATFVQSGAEELRLKKALAAGELKRGESISVELVLEDGSIYPHKGRLLFTDKVVDPSTGALTMRAVFPNSKQVLMPGMFATIRFPQALSESAIKLPQRAVLAGPQGQYVLVVDGDGKVSARPVQTGAMAGPDFVIEQGLKEGDQVIVDGLQKARPGATVKAVPLMPAAAPDGDKPAADRQQGA